MIERTMPNDIGGEMKNESKREIYSGKHVSITYYPDRVIRPKYYLQVLIDKILFPFNMLRFKYGRRVYISRRKQKE